MLGYKHEAPRAEVQFLSHVIFLTGSSSSQLCCMFVSNSWPARYEQT